MENRTSDLHHWILHIRISLGTKVQLSLRILSIWTKFAKKGYFQSKPVKLSTTTEFRISTLQLKLKFQFLGPNLPKRCISRKIEHLHWTLIFELVKLTKFHSKKRILSFEIRFPLKGHFRSKTEKCHFCVRPWSLNTRLNFSARVPTETRAF